MTFMRRLTAGALGAAAGLVFAAGAAEAQAPTAGLSSFPGPSISAHPMAIIKAQKLDEKNGWNLDWQIRTTFTPWVNDYLSGAYHGLHFSGINYLVTNYNKGAPIRIVGASATYPWPLIVKANAGVNSLKDLKGKKVGVPKASYIWAYLRAIMVRDGLDPEKDLKVDNIDILQAIQLVERGDFDAAMPLLEHTIALEKNQPGAYKVLMFPDQEVAKMLGRERMYQVLTMRADWRAANKGGGAKVLKTLAEAQTFVDKDVPAAIKVLEPKTAVSGGQGSGGAALEPYIIEAMYKNGFHGRKMSWYGIPAKDLLVQLKAEMKLYLDAGMIDKLPDDGIFHIE